MVPGSTTVETNMKVPLSQRVNVRMIVFWLVMLALVGFPVYLFLDSTLTGGIRQRGDYTQIDLKAMSNFPFDQINGTQQDVPEIWLKQNGKKVILYGEMWQPQVAAGKISNFELCYSIAKCCFSGPPQIQHFVQAKAAPGSNVEYYDGLVKVTGTLHVNVIKSAGRIQSIYQLDVESVEQG